MSMPKHFGYTLSAVATGMVCGAIAYFTLHFFFPPDPPSKVSLVAFIGGLIGFSIGVFGGWRWAQNIAENLAFELLERVVLGVIAAVARQF